MTPPPADKPLERVIGLRGGLALIVGSTIRGGIAARGDDAYAP
jgi:hypothetical protein